MSALKYLFLFLIYLPLFLKAQDKDAIILIKSDSLYQLNYKVNGELDFIFRFQNHFLDSVGALAFNNEDGFYYGFRFDNGNIIRFDEDGKFENLGTPNAADSLSPNNLTSALIHQGTIYVLSYLNNSIYCVDLEKSPLAFRRLTKNLGISIPNSIAYHPLRQKLFTLDQFGIPIFIDPISGRVERDIKSTFANFPRKKLINYGKIWFANDGRCFLLAGQEGILYELDTENLVAYYIAELGFNSPKDAVSHNSISSPKFIHKEILSMRVNPSKYFNTNLELEWHERNDQTSVFYYFTERFNSDKEIWEEIAFVPGYTSNTQSNRYTTLDRNPLKTENCYRLRIEYQGGYIRYSQSVCYEVNASKLKKLYLSNTVIDYNSNETMLHIKGFKNKNLQISVRPLYKKETLALSYIYPNSDDYGHILKLPEQGGWYEIRVIEAANLYRIPVLKM